MMVVTDMAVVRIPYVKVYTDRFGKVRRYFRKPGRKAMALPGVPGSAEFMAAYQAALGEAAPTPASLQGPGTVGALILRLPQEPGVHRPCRIIKNAVPRHSGQVRHLTRSPDGA